MAPTATATGYSGRGDFSMAADGRLKRRGERDVVPFVYAGAAILTPAFFAGVGPGPSSMTPLFDRAAGIRPAARAAARRHLDACRHPRRRGRGRGGADRQRGVGTRFQIVRRSIPATCSKNVVIMTIPSPRVFTIPASAPFVPTLIARAAQRHPGRGLFRHRRSAGARLRHALPADAARLPAGARPVPRRHRRRRRDPAAHRPDRRHRRGRAGVRRRRQRERARSHRRARRA